MKHRSTQHDRISRLTPEDRQRVYEEERERVETTPVSRGHGASPPPAAHGVGASLRAVRPCFWVSLAITIVIVGGLLTTFAYVKHQFYNRCIWGDDSHDPWCQHFSAMRKR